MALEHHRPSLVGELPVDVRAGGGIRRCLWVCIEARVLYAPLQLRILGAEIRSTCFCVLPMPRITRTPCPTAGLKMGQLIRLGLASRSTKDNGGGASNGNADCDAEE